MNDAKDILIFDSNDPNLSSQKFRIDDCNTVSTEKVREFPGTVEIVTGGSYTSYVWDRTMGTKLTNYLATMGFTAPITRVVTKRGGNYFLALH